MDAPLHRLVVISPDKNTDYCYLDMTETEAVARFTQSEDWLRIYQPAGYTPKAKTLEFGDSFMLWRNMGGDMAELLGQRGAPPEIVDLFRGPDDKST